MYESSRDYELGAVVKILMEKVLTSVNEELVGDPRMVHVMDGCRKDGRQDLQIREDSLWLDRTRDGGRAKGKETGETWWVFHIDSKRLHIAVKNQLGKIE